MSSLAGFCAAQTDGGATFANPSFRATRRCPGPPAFLDVSAEDLPAITSKQVSDRRDANDDEGRGHCPDSVAKKQAGLTWEQIADRIGMSPVWTHSAAMGMNAMPREKAEAMVRVMGLPQDVNSVLEESPTKIWSQPVPTDPCIYRLYEIVGVYGPTIKALIHEKFGDGIMSAIDFDMSVTRIEHSKGDRVKIEKSGKYLGYNSGSAALGRRRAESAAPQERLRSCWKMYKDAVPPGYGSATARCSRQRRQFELPLTG